MVRAPAFRRATLCSTGLTYHISEHPAPVEVWIGQVYNCVVYLTGYSVLPPAMTLLMPVRGSAAIMLFRTSPY